MFLWIVMRRGNGARVFTALNFGRNIINIPFLLVTFKVHLKLTWRVHLRSRCNKNGWFFFLVCDVTLHESPDKKSLNGRLQERSVCPNRPDHSLFVCWFVYSTVSGQRAQTLLYPHQPIQRVMDSLITLMIYELIRLTATQRLTSCLDTFTRRKVKGHDSLPVISISPYPLFAAMRL